MLDQVVVIGYGTIKRSDITGSVSTVKPNVEQTPITSLEQTLQGTAPGVQVTQASSAPGGGISVRIRGGSSVNGNNEPLYVIDGFPVENDANASSPGDGGRANTAPANPLAAINPSDITYDACWHLGVDNVVVTYGDAPDDVFVSGFENASR